MAASLAGSQRRAQQEDGTPLRATTHPRDHPQRLQTTPFASTSPPPPQAPLSAHNECGAQSGCIVWQPPSHDITAGSRFNICVITPNNDQLNKFTHSLFQQTLYMFCKEGDSVPQGCLERATSAPCLVRVDAHTPQGPSCDQGSGDRSLAFRPRPGGITWPRPGEKTGCGCRQRVQRPERGERPVHAGAGAEKKQGEEAEEWKGTRPGAGTAGGTQGPA